MISVDGRVSAPLDGIMAEAGDFDNEGGTNIIHISGSVTEADNAVSVYSYTDGSNMVTVEGNAIGEWAGINAFSSMGGKNFIFVNGDARAIMEDSASRPGRLAVWKIVPDENGAVASRLSYREEEEELITLYTEDKEFEKSIQYVIKVEQPEKGAVLTATAADGSALASVNGVTDDIMLPLANEGDTVLLKVDLEEGYVVTAAYGDEGQTVALSKNAQGDYYIEVPRGGGVYLSVELSEATEEEAQTAVVDPVDPTPIEPVQPVANDAQSDGPAIAFNDFRSIAAFAGQSPVSTENSCSSNNTDVALYNTTVPNVDTLSDEDAIALINATLTGGTVILYGFGGTGLSAAVVAALIARSDISVILTYYADGGINMVSIPAGANLASILNSSSGIDFSTLSATFGSRPF